MPAQHKPSLSHSQASEIVKRLFGMTPSLLCPLPSYDDQNFYVLTVEGGKYILKVMNSVDSKNPTLLEVQTHTMAFLHQQGLPVQTYLTLSPLWADCGFGCQKYLVRLLSYLPGTTISKVLVSPQLLYEVGKMAARMDKILQEMQHPHLSVLQREKFMWNLSNVPLLESYVHLIDGDYVQEVVQSVIQQFKTFVLPKLSAFQSCTNPNPYCRY
uniref:Hydroxylysine kinase n=1 Tax=Myripristis murdjan TaxID=586833 RepID=A0A667WRU3_9TELE